MEVKKIEIANKLLKRIEKLKANMIAIEKYKTRKSCMEIGDQNCGCFLTTEDEFKNFMNLLFTNREKELIQAENELKNL